MNLGTASTQRVAGRAVTALLPFITIVAVAISALARYDVPVQASLIYSAYLFMIIVLPGTLLWRRIWRPSICEEKRNCRLEEWVCGASVGYVLEMIAYPVARSLEHPRLYVLLPALVVLLLGPHEWRQRVRLAEAGPCAGRGVAWGLVGVVGYFVIWLSATVFARYRLTPYRVLDEDEPFHISLVGELRHHFPPAYPQMEAGPLTYQWFVHGHMAASTWLTGMEPVTVYRRMDVLVLGVLCVLGTAIVTMRLSQRRWPGLVSSAVLVLVGSFDVSGAVAGQSVAEDRFMESGLLLNSPTQTMAFALAMPVTLICLEVLRPQHGKHNNIPLWIALAFGMAALSGTKVTFLPIFACGFLASSGVSAWRRRRGWLLGLVGATIAVLVIIGSSRLLYAGDSQSLVWDPGATTHWYMRRLGVQGGGWLGVAVVTAAIAGGWIVSGVGVFGLLRASGLRWDPRVWWLLGGTSAGIGATFLLGHGGMSQLYFGRSVAPLLAIMSGWGMAALFAVGTSRSRAFVAAASSLIGGGTLLLVRIGTERLRSTNVVRGEVVESPLLRVWVNLPALLLLFTVLALIRVLVRDLSSGRHEVPARVIVAFVLGLGLARTLAFLGGHYPEVDVAESEKRLGAGGETAARWLRAHSNPDDRVITNAHCWMDPTPKTTDCDTRHFWMSGLAERRFVLEGWAYTRYGEGWTVPFWGAPDFLQGNDDIFMRPSRRRLREFLAQHPAKWLLADLRQPVASKQLRRIPEVDLVFRCGEFEVYALASSPSAEYSDSGEDHEAATNTCR